MYLLYGENELEINNFIDSILNDNSIDEKIVYNYKECNIEDVILEASYFDLFGNKKLIVLNDAEFLTSKSTLDNENFNSYVSSPNENAILVLKVITDKLDERKKIVKSIKEKAIVKEFKLPDDKNIDSYIKNYFNVRGYKIDDEAILLISDRLKSNTRVLNSELEKLEIYKFDDKVITKDDVCKAVTKYEENNIFKLVDAALKNDKRSIFNLYKMLIENKEEPTVILVLLSNQFRLMYQVKVLSQNGMDKYKIASKLKEHHYRVQLALENSFNIEKKQLLKLLKSLQEIDEKIKTGMIDKNNALETFFLEL